MKQRRRERSLSLIFERLVRLAAPPLLAAPLAACGGQVGDGTLAGDGGTDTLATDAGADAPADTPTTCGATPRPDPIPPCGYQVTLTGDPALCGVDLHDAGPIPPAMCNSLCGSSTINYCYVADATARTLECGGFCEGRRPAGLAPARLGRDGAALAAPPRRNASSTGLWFARSAYLEAASVDAFRILRRELRHHRAPAPLLRACSRAARDEVKHARATTALARLHGVRARKPEVARREVRSLEAIAIENAIEGCVRETFGALLAVAQASEANDPVVRAAMTRIARDETRHSALSWSLNAWIDARLSPASRRRVAAARAKAIETLRDELDRAPRDLVTDRLGVPRGERAMDMLDALGRELWLT
jgi:hypothetical protein